MNYTRVWVSGALLAIAATGVVVACSGSGTDGQGQITQATNPPDNGTVETEEAGAATDDASADAGVPEAGARDAEVSDAEVSDAAVPDAATDAGPKME